MASETRRADLLMRRFARNGAGSLANRSRVADPQTGSLGILPGSSPPDLPLAPGFEVVWTVPKSDTPGRRDVPGRPLDLCRVDPRECTRSEEHTSELQSL